MISIDEYLARAPKLAPSAEKMNNLRAIAQEPVRMDAVTGDADWDHFLAYLEARIKAVESTAEVERTRLASPLLVDPQQIMLVKIAIVDLDAVARTLKEVIMLPKWIKAQGEKAWQVLSELEQKTA